MRRGRAKQPYSDFAVLGEFAERLSLQNSLHARPPDAERLGDGSRARCDHSMESSQSAGGFLPGVPLGCCLGMKAGA